MADEEDGHWAAIKARDLIQGNIGPDHRVIQMRRFHLALVQALKEAYEEGLAAGMALGGDSTKK